jgi:predicted  nucleic acid-binding Zn-ribbon protein
MATKYNGNLVELRQKREKLLAKKHRLNLEIKRYDKLSIEARNKIFENIHKLSLAIESCNREIEKVQKSMQNSNKWMDGDYNAVEF